MIFESFAEGQLQWLPQSGIGYYQAKDRAYDDSYDESLVDYNLQLVNKYTKLDVLDINIGSGAFVYGRENTYGYDSNPLAVEWLVQRKLYRHPFKGANSLNFLCSLQKIQDPRLHLSGAKEYVFVLCPIFCDAEQILSSERYLQGKDCWYWTKEGLCVFMDAFGFELVEYNDMKSQAGKENIGSFVFKKY